MCLSPNPERKHDPLYTVYDFARATEGDFSPKALDISLFLQPSSQLGLVEYCGVIPEFHSGEIFLLVERVPDYEAHRPKMIRTSALVLVSIFAFLYGLLTLASLVLSYTQMVRTA